MPSDSSQIPVQPIPFEHGLTHLALALDRKQVKIVAIGSSTTAGEGGIAPYPERLLALLRADYPGVWIDDQLEDIRAKAGMTAPSAGR